MTTSAKLELTDYEVSQLGTQAKGLWFSRHEATLPQINDARRMGYELVIDKRATELASFELRENDQIDWLVNQLLRLADELDVSAIFGVFPVPLQNRIALSTHKEFAVRCYGSWNIARSAINGKPTFEHKEFMWVGNLAEADYAG